MTDRSLISGHAEAKLTSLSNREDGGIRMGFVIQPDDVTPELRAARPGTFFMLGYQQFDPDAREAPETDKPAPKKRDQTPSQHCATWCGNKEFQKWLGIYPTASRAYAEDLAACEVRERLDIGSRSELDTNPEAAERWKRLHTEFLHRHNLAREA